MNILKCLAVEFVGLLALLAVAVGYALIWWLWLPGWAVLFVGLFILADAWAVRWAIERYIKRRGFLDPAPDPAPEPESSGGLCHGVITMTIGGDDEPKTGLTKDEQERLAAVTAHFERVSKNWGNIK